MWNDEKSSAPKKTSYTLSEKGFLKNHAALSGYELLFLSLRDLLSLNNSNVKSTELIPSRVVGAAEKWY